MYIPLNKIITNLYTNGNELQFKSNSDEYVGSYWKDYRGKMYTGQNPNDTPTQELITLSDNFPQTSEITTQNVQLYSDVTEDLTSNPQTSFNFQATRQLIDYNEIKEINIDKLFNIPSQSFPQPSPKDYSLGAFRRYFTVKQNQSIYLEINQNTFHNLKKRKSDWDWQPYIPFSIPWTLIGEEKVTNQTNKNIVLLQERRLKKLGLKEYLRFNYLKYYRPDSGEDLYTNGGDYLNERTGQEYVGYYHIHPIKGPMVGQFHVESDHDYLIPITGNTSGSLSNTPTSPSSPPSSGYSPSSGGGGGGY